MRSWCLFGTSPLSGDLYSLNWLTFSYTDFQIQYCLVTFMVSPTIAFVAHSRHAISLQMKSLTFLALVCFCTMQCLIQSIPSGCWTFFVNDWRTSMGKSILFLGSVVTDLVFTHCWRERSKNGLPLPVCVCVSVYMSVSKVDLVLLK